MKIIRSARLWFREGAYDKVYEVDLIENDALRSDARFLVNTRHGRRGTALREGTKTASPIIKVEAERVFDSVVVSKVNEGYRRSDRQAAVPRSPTDPGADPQDGRKRELLSRLDACLRSPWPEKARERLLWRIGEVRVRAAAPALIALAGKLGTAGASYSLVFALARAAGSDAAPVLRTIAEGSPSYLVRELARFALVSPLMSEARQPAGFDPACPEAVVAAAKAHDVDRIAGSLAELAMREPLTVRQALIALGRAAQDDDALRSALAAAILRMPVRPPYLIGLRKLYKYAEMADDAALFAATAHRFETAQPMYRRPGWRGNTYIHELKTTVQLDAMRAAPDTRVGLSEATLHYFKRRIWRTLRKRAELGDPSFVDLASSYLLSLRPGDLSTRTTWTHFLRAGDGTWGRENRSFGPLAKNWTASQLLYRNAAQMRARYRSLTFVEAPGIDEAVSSEAFPELWSRRPDLALRLASESACEPVALFGVRLLKADPDFISRIPSAQIGRLLASPHLAVLQLAFEEARDRLARGHGDDTLLAALIGSKLIEARRLAADRIERDGKLPWSSLPLAFATLTASTDDLTELVLFWARERPLGADVGAELAAAIATWLLAAPAIPDEPTLAAIRTVRSRIRALWSSRNMPLGQDNVRQLMEHPAPAIAAAGIEILGLTGVDPATLSDETWRRLLGSESEEVQEAALALFGGLGQEALAKHAPLIVAFATAPSSRLRQAARPLVARIAARDPALADTLARDLIDSLFLTAPDEEYPADIVALLKDALPGQLEKLDANTLWRLLQARAKGAQLLGASILAERPFATFSVRQTARLGHHAHLAVRRWAMSAFEAAPERFQAEAADAVLLVETPWTETYEFARDHFAAWPETAWTPDALAVVTDSVKPEVLAFARQLLRSRLSPADAEAQLTRLLEHPAQSMHLLVTELLTEDAAASAATFEKLMPLARIVMLQVRKGRVAKDRMAGFLKQEALRDGERARAIAPLFTDLTLSGEQRDRTQAILALRDIADRHPGIATPLARRQTAERAA